jgi:chromate transporter
MWRIGKAALKSWLQVALATAAFAAFHFAQVSFVAVLAACGAAYWFLQPGRAPPGAVAGLAALLWPWRARAMPADAERLADIAWFFLKVGLFSFGGAYAALPYMRQAAVLDRGWLTDAQMMDGLALGETTPGPLISIGVFVGYLAGQPYGVPWLGASTAAFWLFLPSFVFVLAGAPHLDALTRRPGVQEVLKGITAGVVGLMLSISVLLAQVAFSPGGRVDPWTIALGAAALAVLLLWKSKLNVVVVVLGGGVLGLLGTLARA